MSDSWHGGKGDKSRIDNYNSYLKNYDAIYKKSNNKMKKIEYHFRKNEAILQGDTHSLSVTYDIISTRIDTGTDYIHLGDCGIGFGDLRYSITNTLSWLDKINKLCKTLDINAYIIRGNHDAVYPAIWDSKYSNVFLIGDHAYGTFPNGKKSLLVSGGISVDRCTRTKNFDYWVEEPTKYIENIDKCDFMFSHDCPDYLNHNTLSLNGRFKWAIDKDPTLIDDCLKQRSLMSDIVERSCVKVIHYGHMHNNIKQTVNGVYGRCVDINELYFFDSTESYI